MIRKQLLLILCMFLFGFGQIFSQDQSGRFSLGANISYGSKQDLIGFGARAQYGFTEHIRGVGEYKYYLDRRDWSEWQINWDVHYVIPVSDSFSLYPIGGIRYSRWTVDTGRGSSLDGARWKKSFSRVGLNLGAGGQVQLTDNLYLQLEPKWEISKKFSQFTGTVGLMLEL